MLHRLVDAGNTVVVIEHNLDVMAEADWIIDLGPEAGERGRAHRGAGRRRRRWPRAAAHSHTGRVLEAFLRERTLPVAAAG